MLSALESILRTADATERRWLCRHLANVLAALPAAQAEAAAHSPRVRLPQLNELARQVAMLEAAIDELAHEHGEIRQAA